MRDRRLDQRPAQLEHLHAMLCWSYLLQLPPGPKPSCSPVPTRRQVSAVRLYDGRHSSQCAVRPAVAAVGSKRASVIVCRNHMLDGANFSAIDVILLTRSFRAYLHRW